MEEIEHVIAENSKHRKVLRLLFANANAKGYVKDLTLDVIVANLNLSSREVTRVLWEMQKQELVGFTEKRSTGELYRFRLRRKALESMDRDHSREVTDAIQQPQDVQPIGLVVTMPTADESHKYPLMKLLLVRRGKLNQASKLLEDAGADEEALKVMEMIDSTGPLEKEILRYFENHLEQKLRIVADS